MIIVDVVVVDVVVVVVVDVAVDFRMDDLVQQNDFSIGASLLQKATSCQTKPNRNQHLPILVAFENYCKHQSVAFPVIVVVAENGLAATWTLLLLQSRDFIQQNEVP